MRRVRLPLNFRAAQAADAALLRETGGRPLDPCSEADASLRERWLQAYAEAGGEVEELTLSGRTVASPVQSCPLWNIDLLYLHANGAPVGGASYVITSVSGELLYQGNLGQDGRARICGVPLEHRSFLFYFRGDPRPFEPFLQPVAVLTPEDKDSFAEELAEWLWGALQGDFNENPTYGQIAFDTLLALVPGLDQLLDVRDITAGVLSLIDYYSQSEQQRQRHRSRLGLDHETWLWLGVFITVIGFVPSLGSVAKGVFKALKRYLESLGVTAELLSHKRIQELWQLLVDTMNSLGQGNAHKWMKELPGKLEGGMADATQRIRSNLALLRQFCQQLEHAARKAVGWLIDRAQLAVVLEITRKIQAGIQKIYSRLVEMQARVLEWLNKQVRRVLEGKQLGAPNGAAGTEQAPVINVRQQRAVDPPSDDFFQGRLKGEAVDFPGVKTERISYTKRNPEETARLRRSFDSSGRKEFLQDLASDPEKVQQLRNAGLNDVDIAKMRAGISRTWCSSRMIHTTRQSPMHRMHLRRE